MAYDADPTDRRRAPDGPLFTPARVAGGVAVILAVAMIGYLLAFGGFRRILTALGLAQPPATAGALPASGPGALVRCGEDLGQLQTIVLSAFNVMGELPAREALADADGQPTTDPWGNFYRYHLTPDRRQFWFSSDGPDGIPDTPDDLTTPKAP